MKYQIYEREDRLYVPVPTGLILLPWLGWLPERKPTVEEAYTEALFKVRERYLPMHLQEEWFTAQGTPA